MYKKCYKSPIGIINMESDGEYLKGLWFENSPDSSKHNSNLEEKELKIFDETVKWLDIYFEGKNPGFTPKYKIENMTDFRQQVIDIMNKIPYGQTVTYNDIAQEIARKQGIKRMSAQAVGGANVVGIYNFFPIYELIHKYQSLDIIYHIFENF